MPKKNSARSVWKLYKTDERRISILKKELGISEICAQLLLNRGVRSVASAHDFLYGSLSSLSDPFKMKDMRRARDRIRKAVSDKQKILVYGDYDVDGVASCALLANVLTEMGASFEVFIPNRLEEGYGLNIDAVEKAAESGNELIITVDCGINSIKEVERARELGVDVVVTDHHEIKGREIPEASAVVDPHREDCAYPYKYLAGVGVVYCLATALCGEREALYEDLDLVALGSIADVVPLNGENRILVKNGLKVLANTKKPGIKALLELSGPLKQVVSARDVSFGVAPRINAMGRMGSAQKAYELLTAKTSEKGRKLALELDKNNKERKSVETKVFKEALQEAEKQGFGDNDKCMVLAGDHWHPGVIGIVASRISERFAVPAVLISLDGEVGRGSGRSIEGVDIFKAIRDCNVKLIQFGGHEQACGLRIKRSHIDAFREGLNRVLQRTTPEETTAEEIRIDYHLPFSHITKKTIEELSLLMPYGQANPAPVIVTGGIEVRRPPRNIGRNGFKLHVGKGTMVCEAITFKKDGLPRPKKGDLVDLVYDPSINSYRGIDSIQLNIKDMRISPVGDD